MKAIIDDRVKGSTREIIDQEEEIEVRIKQARLEVERNYRSTLDILSNDLKNVKEDLARRDAIFEKRVTLIEKRVEKKYLSTIRTLHEDLGIVTGARSNKRRNIRKKRVS